MQEETELCKLALKYRSDKCPRRGKHTYTPYYFDIFKNKKAKTKKVLEIGIGKGASLKMWRDFFPNAQIYGADYRTDLQINSERITSFLSDQRRSEHLRHLISNIGGDIDIVIEDGSHRPRDQVSTCLTLMPLLQKNVIYVIEDVYDPSIVERLNKYYEVEVPPIDQPRERYDNRLVVVRHKPPPINLSFFAKDPYRIGHDRHLGRVSSIIRGQQIAYHIGAKLNPTEDYQNDVCIYVKPPWKPGDDFKFEGIRSCLDLVDETGYYELLKNHPEVTVITLSDLNYKIVKRDLPNHKIVNIPQQHCNFERARRRKRKITTVGIIGTIKAFDYLPKGIEEALAKRSIKFIKFSQFTGRQDIIDFYLNIDVQLVWRPYAKKLSNPLKIVNAMSFGVPTIAYDEPCFQEVKGGYIPVTTMEEFLKEFDKLTKTPKLYEKYNTICLKKSEKYHIDKIGQLYKNLTKQ